MDYEKLHKETLERLQQRVREGKMTEEVAKYICPDFVAESEDERIRKWIVNLLHELRYDPTAQPMALKAIEYLEKQKKQPMELLEPDKNVEKIIEDIIRVYGKTQGEWVGGYDIDTLIVNLRRAFEQEEQKPALRLVGDGLISDPNAHFELVGEQKPVECVTDAEMKKGLDELTKFKCFASVLSDMYNIIPSHSSLRPKDIDWNNFCAWLLTYLKRNQPAEWSEEDIDKMVNARARKSGTTKSEIEFYRQGIKDTLKSLRPQPHWKPSEYTLSLVKKVANGEMLTHMEQMAMGTLYDNLQKL